MTRQVMSPIERIAIVTLATVALFAALSASVPGASATYEYDTNGCLATVRYFDGTVVNYTYDARGNRKTWTRTTAAPDTTPPAAPGMPSFSSVTMTSATASWTAATDDRGVVGYDYRVNTGSWQSLSNVLSASIAGLSAATAYTVAVRARDGAGNLGPASSLTFEVRRMTGRATARRPSTSFA